MVVKILLSSRSFLYCPWQQEVRHTAHWNTSRSERRGHVYFVILHLFSSSLGPANPLSVHIGAIGAAQITQHDNAMGLHQNAMLLRDALLLKARVAVLLPTNDGDFARQIDFIAVVKRNQFDLHIMALNSARLWYQHTRHGGTLLVFPG